MPPPQRVPSLPGATQASKKAFKPPGRLPSDPNIGSSEPKTNAWAPVANRGAPKFNRANPNASRPTSAASSRAGSAAPGKAAAPNNGKSTVTSGFARATTLDDIELISSDDEDFDAAFDTVTAESGFKPASKAVEATTSNAANKRKQLTRLPSLSDSSATPPRELSPIHIDDDENNAPVNEPQNDASNIGTEADDIPLLPAPILTRLLHESFDDKQMKISKDANALMARYLDVFVREAVARAALAHKEHKESGEGLMDVDMDDDIWLDTRDLEEIAPGLVLDF